MDSRQNLQHGDDSALFTEDLETLDLSVRSMRCLQSAGIMTIQDLTSRSSTELLSIKTFGEGSLDEVQRRLKTRGLTLASSDTYDGPPESMPIALFGVPPLLHTTLHTLNITTVGSLADLTTETIWNLPKIGPTKGDLLFDHVLRARAHTGRDEPITGTPLLTQLPHLRNAPLPFVPGVLDRVFTRRGVTSFEQLFSLDHRTLRNERGFGSTKLEALRHLQSLYNRLLNLDSRDPVTAASFVKDVVPSFFVGDPALRELSVDGFIDAPTTSTSDKTEVIEDIQRVLTLFVRTTAFTEQAGHHAPMLAMAWRDLLTSVQPKPAQVFADFNIVVLDDLYQFLLSDAYPIDARDRKDTDTRTQIGSVARNLILTELNLLFQTGVTQHLYGLQHTPHTAVELAESISSRLGTTLFAILQDRLKGNTLEEVATTRGITRERVRQLETKALTACLPFRPAANGLLLRLEDHLRHISLADEATCCSLTGAEEHWQFRMISSVAGKQYNQLDSENITNFTDPQLEVIRRVIKEAINKGEFSPTDASVSVNQLMDSSTAFSPDVARECRESLQGWDPQFTPGVMRKILGNDWLLGHVRSQLADAGKNGLFFDQFAPGWLIESKDILSEIVSGLADLLPDGRFRKQGKNNSYSDAFIDFAKKATEPFGAQDFISQTKTTLQQPQVVSYLSELYEIVSISRGKYVHIDTLSLTERDIIRIAEWGSALLAGEQEVVDANDLFELYADSGLDLPLTDAHQLLSIIAKHADVRRIGGSKLAHRNSFAETNLFLANTDPDLAAQWHPEMNGAATPENVRPASDKICWWRCEKGHEFQASLAYRTRTSRTCPGCQERWTVNKIRHFVQSLQGHLETLTPAELYVIFQQSGLLQSGGKARGFVKALTTGRFPKQEIDKFCEGEESLVDEFIDDSNVTLDEISPLDDQEPVHDTGNATDNQPEKSDLDVHQLPEVNTRDALSALDNPVICSTDSEATEFLVESAKAKVWSHAYRDEQGALKEVGKFGESVYAEQVCSEFIEEYEAARELAIPEGYSFTVEGKPTLPNLMQRQVAAQIQKQRRYANWSGTGAGKTLSAILATRVVDASLTVVCCPNAVVGAAGGGWASEIRKVFPDSEVITKTLSPTWSGDSPHRYLVLNYEQFQQPDSESRLKAFVENNRVDFVVIDEIHFAKQRHAEQMSQRKRLVQALVAVAGETNPELCVLGMSATPVINNLQEGKSLVEMVSGVEHEDLNVKATIPNCMHLHQKLVTLGTRWRPSYATLLDTETVDVDCSAYLDEIRALGKSSSPLQYETILTRARLPVILDYLANGRRTLVYTHYVQEIDRLLNEAISAAGYRVGFCTGETKSGLEAFKQGKLDVLVGSSAVGTGVDGLQYCCNQLIINVLPWTNAEYEQLIGRIWRQGQTETDVKVVIPVTFADVNGERWSYCDTKLDRIRYKKSIADSAVDGAVPEGNLRSPAQAQQDVMAWLTRLAEGQLATITRRQLTVPLSDDVQDVQQRLGRYGDFSQINQRWNQTHSDKLAERLQQNPEEWEQYHTLYRQARTQWSVVPIEEMVTWCNNREGYEIGDFGCGEALLAKEVGDRHTVHSFDHIAINDAVIEGDMSATSLDDESLDVALFSLSLMGHNFTDYLREAHRVLKLDGQLHIWEATSRFNDVDEFCTSLEQLGFKTFPPLQKGRFTHIEAQATTRKPRSDTVLQF